MKADYFCFSVYLIILMFHALLDFDFYLFYDIHLPSYGNLINSFFFVSFYISVSFQFILFFLLLLIFYLFQLKRLDQLLPPLTFSNNYYIKIKSNILNSEKSIAL